MYIGINDTFTDDYFIKYSALERAGSISAIEHPIVRCALQIHDLAPAVEIVSLADIPSGTGLGSSGSFTVGSLRAIYAHRREHVVAGSLADEACRIEIEMLGRGRKQDQYIAAFGGITCLEFNKNGSVVVSPLMVTNDTLHDLGGAQVQSYVGDGARWGLSVRYSDEEGDLRGTAGASRLASERGLVDDVFSVVYGDSYLPCREKLCGGVPPRGGACSDYGLLQRGPIRPVECRVLEGLVDLYEKGVERPGMRYIDYGMSIVERSVVEARVPSGTPRDLADLFHELSLAGLLAVRGPRAVFRGGIRGRDRGPRALPSSGRRLATPTDDPSAESPRLACGGSLRFRVALGRGGRARCPRWKRSPWSVRRWPKRESRSTSTEVLPMTRYFWCRPTTSVVPSSRSSCRR